MLCAYVCSFDVGRLESVSNFHLQETQERLIPLGGQEVLVCHGWVLYVPVVVSVDLWWHFFSNLPHFIEKKPMLQELWAPRSSPNRSFPQTRVWQTHFNPQERSIRKTGLVVSVYLVLVLGGIHTSDVYIYIYSKFHIYIYTYA